MSLNRRHKAILFITLVVTGCALLLDVELRAAIGFMMLGGALAWAIGSDTASGMYSGLKGASGIFYSWIRQPLAMALAGAIFGAVLLYSRANPIVVVVFMCIAGIFLAPLTPFPTQRIWLRIPLILLALSAFLIAMWGIISTDVVTSNKYAERYGQLTGNGLITFIVAYFWLSKGWGLIERGIGATPPFNTLPLEGSKGKPWGQYISLAIGVLLLTLCLALLAWSSSSNWEYAPEKLTDTKGNNPFAQFFFIILLAAWPYASWKNILNREPNADPMNLRRHRRTSVIAGMIFVVVMSLAITYGVQNGSDRRMTDKIEAVAKDLTAVGNKIGAIKRRDLRTTEDYVRAYAEIGELLPEFDVRINEYADVYKEARQIDENRGLINTQFFYRSHKPEIWKNNLEMLVLLRAVDSLTKQEVLAAQNMAALPTGDQVEFWQKEFKPLLLQEDDLRQKIQIVAAKIQSY